MNVRNCKKCGTLFNYISGPPICLACKEKMEDVFQVVKKFVRQNPHANLQTVAEECEVEVSQIKQWIREERLEFAEDSAIMLPCENCGAMIRSGRFCEHCKNTMVKNLDSVRSKPKMLEPEKPKKKDSSNKMRFLDRK